MMQLGQIWAGVVGWINGEMMLRKEQLSQNWTGTGFAAMLGPMKSRRGRRQRERSGLVQKPPVAEWIG
jgi:hypothetical protein